MERQLIALLLTIILELFAVLLLLYLLKFFHVESMKSPKEPSRWIEKLCLCCCAASLCSHPFAWYFNQIFEAILVKSIRFTSIELAVILVESYFYVHLMGFKWKIGFLYSVVANLFSFLLGLKIYPLVVRLVA